MNVSPSKENILKKIRKALSQTTPIPFPGSEGTGLLFRPRRQELEIEFGEQFSRLTGKFAYCFDTRELCEQLQALLVSKKWDKVICVEPDLAAFLPTDKPLYTDLASADAAVTSCEALIARTGSLLMSTAQKSGRATSVYAPIHICIAYTDQLVYDVKDGLQLIRERYAGKIPSLVTLATGPSRTADIEKTLVVGVHGPKEVYVFLVEKS